MKKVIEVNPKFSVGDIIYAVHDNKAVKGKIKDMRYIVEEDIINGQRILDWQYTVVDINSKNDFWVYDRYKSIFKSKDDIIDYLKTQIDKITTDDYSINCNF